MDIYGVDLSLLKSDEDFEIVLNLVDNLFKSWKDVIDFDLFVGKFKCKWRCYWIGDFGLFFIGN